MSARFAKSAIGRIAVVFAALAVLSSCAEWPPLSGWATDNFRKSRNSLEALEELLVESKYEKVHAFGPDRAYGIYSEDGIVDEEFIEDGGVWGRHFESSRIAFVQSVEGGTLFSPGLDPFVARSSRSMDDRPVGSILYLHLITDKRDFSPCTKEHMKDANGVCGVRLGDGWWILYSWSIANATQNANSR